MPHAISCFATAVRLVIGFTETRLIASKGDLVVAWVKRQVTIQILDSAILVGLR